MVTDGSKSYLGLKEYFLKQVVGMPDELTLYWTHKIIALLKKLGTRHLPRLPAPLHPALSR